MSRVTKGLTCHRLLCLTVSMLIALLSAAAPLRAATAFADPAFQAQWQQGEAITPNFWGPLGTASPGQQEPYQESSGGQRLVQYFDKGRMELTNGTVTNGLLATDLVKGQIQVGNNAFQRKDPPNIPIAGDPDNPGPTYAMLARSANQGLFDAAPAQTGSHTQAGLSPTGNIFVNDTGATAATTFSVYDDVTKHNVPKAFADYRAQAGLATIGYALCEPFTTTVKVAGQQEPVMVQVFQRRVLTDTASNPAQFQVEMGNIGAHYFLWRYGKPLTSAQPTPPAAAPQSSNTLPTLANGTPYQDPSGRFTTRYPAGWTVKVDSDTNINFLALPNAGPAGINVSPRLVDASTTLEEYKQNDLDWLVPRLKDYHQLSDTKIMVGQYPGYKRVFTQTNDEGQYEEIVRYYIRAGNYVFVVNCYCAPQDESKYMPLFDGTTGSIAPR